MFWASPYRVLFTQRRLSKRILFNRIGLITLSRLVFDLPNVITSSELYIDILTLGALRDRESGYHMNKELVGKRSQNTDADRRRQPTRVEAEAAVRTLIEWAGDNPDREGLLGTPERVVRAYEEFFAGYHEDPVALLTTTFQETADYDEMIVMRDIRLESHCEHHIVPILGKVHIGYLPSDRVVGISKLARVVEVFAKRLQIQETLTAQIADTIQKVLQPQGVGVVIEAAHQCMTTRGVRKPGVSMVTSRMLGSFRDDPTTRREFLSIIGNPRSGIASA